MPRKDEGKMVNPRMAFTSQRDAVGHFLVRDIVAFLGRGTKPGFDFEYRDPIERSRLFNPFQLFNFVPNLAFW